MRVAAAAVLQVKSVKRRSVPPSPSFVIQFPFVRQRLLARRKDLNWPTSMMPTFSLPPSSPSMNLVQMSKLGLDHGMEMIMKESLLPCTLDQLLLVVPSIIPVIASKSCPCCANRSFARIIVDCEGCL